MKKPVLALGLILILLQLNIQAQTVQGTITGAPIPNLEVTLGDKVAHTNSEGHYEINLTSPLEFEWVFPNGIVTINEGESVDFVVSATDADNDSLHYAWMVNSVIQPEDSTHFKYQTDFTSAGWDTVVVQVQDDWYTISHEWLVKVVNVNRRPRILAFYPPGDTTISEMDSVLFRISAMDLDNEPLTYE